MKRPRIISNKKADEEEEEEEEGRRSEKIGTHWLNVIDTRQ